MAFRNGLSKTCLVIAAAIFFVSCGGETKNVEQSKIVYKSIQDIPENEWKLLANKKIYFAHQSVGQNIIDGVKELMVEHPQIRLNIMETSDLSDFKGGVFAHSRINGNKPEFFKKSIQDELSANVDIAFFKFCFVDILESTDINRVFDQYKNTMQQLQSSHPDIQFLHVTVPITYHQTGIEAFIAKTKSLINRALGRFDYNQFFDNRNRDMINEMFRQEYGGRSNFFDIAEIQSTRPDGTIETFEQGGKTYNAMAKDYTDDGGHLNARGRRLVAEQLLLTLVNLDVK